MQSGSSISYFDFLHNGTASNIFTVCQFGVVANPNAVYCLLANGGGTTQRGIAILYNDTSGLNNAISNSVFRGVSATNAVSATLNNAVTANSQVLTYYFFDADNATAADRFVGEINNDGTYATNASTSSVTLLNASNQMFLGRWPTAVQFRQIQY